MKLTPMQRYTVYILMYYNLGNYGMCCTFHEIFEVSNRDCGHYSGKWFLGYSDVLCLLPEIRRKEPHIHDIPTSSYWFECDKTGYIKRRKILEECIIEMEQKLFK